MIELTGDLLLTPFRYLPQTRIATTGIVWTIKALRFVQQDTSPTVTTYKYNPYYSPIIQQPARVII